MNRKEKLAKNTIILSIGTVLPKLASFIILPLLTGCLSKEEYGAYDLITVLVSLVLPTATIQIHAAAFRFLVDCRGNDEKTRSIVTNIIVFIFPISLVALVILFFALPSLDITIRIFICLYFFADIMVNAARQISRGLNRNLDFSISAVLSALGKMIFTVIGVYWLKAGLLGTVISLFLASLCSLVYITFKSKLFIYVQLQCFDKFLLKRMLGYSWPMVPNSMSAWIMRVSDRFVVTAVMGLSANAVYAVANKIPSLLNIAQSTFTMAWQENASIASKDEDASEYYTSMFHTMFDLMTGLFGLLIAATPLLFLILIRGDYEQAYYHMPILFLAMLFYSLSTFLGGIYVAYMRSKSVGITTMIAAAINLVTDMIAIRSIGLFAASGSTLVSYIFLFVFRIVDIQKIVSIKINWKHCIFVLCLVICESVFCFLKNPFFNVFNVFFSVLVFFGINKPFVLAVFTKLRHMKRKNKT